MDRKSNKKINRFWLLGLLFFVFLIGTLYLFFKREIGIRDTQLQEMLTIYPELQTELMDNFAFYKAQSLAAVWQFGIALVVIILLFLVSFQYWKKDWQKEAMREVRGEIELIYEQLQQFRKGEFVLMPELSDIQNAGKWIGIHELLRELGYYFSDLKEQLAEEENSTKALITDISHQLKTPLASLRLSHELANTENLTEEERKEFLATEEQELNKLETLLEELVKLSRLECNMIQIKPELQSIKQTITEALNQVFMKAHCNNIDIDIEFEKDVQVTHDAKWTVEALANVMENATKYSEAGTVIHIRTECLPTNFLIEVEDEGMGIPEEEIHKIFKRFYRGNQARKTVKDGAGVGLYLSRSILERQGGTIVAKRKMGRGTIFKITLPL